MPSRLSSLLVRDGLVGVRRMEKAFQRQVIYGGSLDTILLELGMVPEDRLCQYLALASGLPPASRTETATIDPAAVALLPLEQAQAYRAVPLALEGDAVRMAVASPIDLAALEDLADHVDRPLRPLLVPEYRWHVMLEKAYGVATPTRFATLANQIESEAASQPVGRSRTVIVENEPERDIVATAQPLAGPPPPPQPELARTRSRPTEPSTPVRAAAAAQNAGETVRSASGPIPVSQPPSPSGPRRRGATLLGVSPVRALTDEPLQGDLIPSDSMSSGVPQELELGDDLTQPTAPWVAPQDERLTAPRRAVLSPAERAELRSQVATRPLARRRPSPESLVSISAAARAPIDEARPLPGELTDDHALEVGGADVLDEVSATEAQAAAGTPVRAPHAEDSGDLPVADGMEESLALAAQLHAEAEARAAQERAAREAREAAARAEAAADDAPHEPSPRGAPRASTAPIDLPADTSPISPRDARELLLVAEHRDDVFVALLRAMRHVAHWAGLLTIHGGAAIGRLALAQPELDAEKIRTVLIPLDAPSPVRTAMTSRRPYVGPLAKGDAAVDAMFLRMGDVRPPSLAVIPLVLRDRVVAMIVGHRGAAELSFSDVSDLLPLASLASEAIGRLILRQKAETGRIAIEPPARPSSPNVPPARPSSPNVPPARPSSPNVAPARPSSPSVAPARPSSPSVPLARPSSPSIPPAARAALPALPYSSPSHELTRAEPPADARAASPPAPSEPRTPRRELDRLPATAAEPAPIAQGSVPAAAAPSPLDVDALLDLIDDRNPGELEAALDEAIARAAEVLPVLAARFPGVPEIERSQTPGRPLAAAQYGGLLELVTRLGSMTADMLVDKMRSPDSDVRYYAAVCAAELRPRQAIPALLERLFDPDQGVRACALEALRGYPAKDLEPALTRTRAELHSDDDERVAAAAEALAELCDRDAIPDLVLALGRGDRAAEAARSALVQLTWHDLGASERKWKRWWDEHQRQHRIEWLIEALALREDELRAGAFAELGRLTGETLGYQPEAPRRERDLAHRRWLTWWIEEGRRRFTTESERRRPSSAAIPRRDGT